MNKTNLTPSAATPERIFIEVTIKSYIAGLNGRKKKISKKVLVEARNFGEAESSALREYPDAEITLMRKSRVQGVLCASNRLPEDKEIQKDIFQPHELNESVATSCPFPKSSLTSGLPFAGRPINRRERRELERREAKALRSRVRSTPRQSLWKP